MSCPSSALPHASTIRRENRGEVKSGRNSDGRCGDHALPDAVPGCVESAPSARLDHVGDNHLGTYGVRTAVRFPQPVVASQGIIRARHELPIGHRTTRQRTPDRTGYVGSVDVRAERAPARSTRRLKAQAGAAVRQSGSAHRQTCQRACVEQHERCVQSVFVVQAKAHDRRRQTMLPPGQVGTVSSGSTP